MARFVDPDSSRKKIDELMEIWKDNCLLSDGSLLFEGRSIWTEGNLRDFRERFLENPLVGEAPASTSEVSDSGEQKSKFERKLETQLQTAEDDVRWLVCELIAVYFLFARGAIGGESKRKVLNTIVEPIEGEKPPGWTRLMETMDEGIGNPGSGYNIRRDLQINYLLDFAVRFKRLESKEQRDLLDDPWLLSAFADDASDGVSPREMRNILIHLLRPDEFERISSRTHKQNIVDAFREEFLGSDPPEDLDAQLLEIRGKLEALEAQGPDAHLEMLDFYQEPLRGLWDTGSDRSEGASDLDLLLHKKQAVLFGPPGTGKTHRTRQLAATLIRREALRKWKAKRFFASQDELDAYIDSNVEWVQLHPGYGYEEFVRGLRLVGDQTEYVDGLLPRLVASMAAVPEKERLPVVLVLDEINRTDLSRMFGEAFSLLENRGKPALLPGVNADDDPSELILPDNLYVIGTMNLIDQSVEELDFALRRRFFWIPAGFDATPIIEVNKSRWAKLAPPKYGWDRAEGDMGALALRAEMLNQEITNSQHLGAQYVLGHTYYFDAAFFASRWLKGVKMLTGGVLWTAKGRPRQSIEDLWTFSLEPLLAQYLGGLDPKTAQDELERLKTVLLLGKAE